MTYIQASYEQLKENLECFFTIEEQAYLFPVLLSWAEEPDKVIFWFNNKPIPAFGNITALSVCEGGHAKAFIEYIKGTELGGNA
ncbi:hypothetical protein ACRN9C_02485 [Shewanella frigidimarina]|jgi:hypothetical protein|uniref:hypothetical protein n=1 Tax=Shewanella TaxID=22 RepID=UPI000C799E1E|nr:MULTISPECIES: hypothetical protein [Shewanella]MBB1321086.1 hypothetical protein [Shewanella sp. SR43-8]PKI02923.1 hypothetical protein CXF78_11335 [Shewanella sp. 11B5]RPA30789.1 hypothetical protein EGC78_14235 [Shewanella frigidimarina]|tara:strand:+ start:5222 stop:5473 length:252 start_codon:yes stop_codon:yes gene_type:complete